MESVTAGPRGRLAGLGVRLSLGDRVARPQRSRVRRAPRPRRSAADSAGVARAGADRACPGGAGDGRDAGSRLLPSEPARYPPLSALSFCLADQAGARTRTAALARVVQL